MAGPVVRGMHADSVSDSWPRTGTQVKRYFLTLSFALLSACGSASPASSAGGGSGGLAGSGGSLANGGGPANSVCVAGLQVECACAGGISSVQACKADGSGYLACECGAGGGGESAGGGAGGNEATAAGTGGESGASDGGSAGTNDGTALGTLNQPCVGEGSPACQGHAAKQQLICSTGKWIANGTCAGSNDCDTTPGSNAGSCQPIAPPCAALRPGDTYCNDQTVERCGVDLVTTAVVQTCSATTPACLGGSCVECTPDATRCSATQVDHIETCSADGAWAPAIACPGGGGCELCNGSDPYCDHAMGTYGCGF
jgi:hypothetical protein